MQYFLAASQHPFYLSWVEFNTFNSIGLIYARRGEWEKAARFYRATGNRAASKDSTWVGIASGNLGNVFLATGQHDSALFYHRRNWHINNYYINPSGRAPEDAAKSALVIAKVFIRQRQPDSALSYIHSGQKLAGQFIVDAAEKLGYRRRLLKVLMELHKERGDYPAALWLSDSLANVKDSLQQMLDDKILNRATEKAEAERYGAEIRLLESEKALSRLRFYVLAGLLLLGVLVASLLF